MEYRKDFKSALINKTIPNLTLDQKWHRLFAIHGKTDEIKEYRAENGDFFGVFVFVGYSPDTEAVKDIIELNEQGYIITNSELKTNIDGYRYCISRCSLRS